MNTSNKKYWYIGIIVIVLLFVFVFLDTKDSENKNTQSETFLPQVADEGSVPMVTNETVHERSENPSEQKDTVNQPAYLIDAYTRDGVDYVWVDYVLVFSGEEAVQAQIEDGLCVDASECVVPQGGYIRNNNPHHRTYEVSTTTSLRIEAKTAIKTALEAKGIQKDFPSFIELSDVISTMPNIIETTFPYKDAKSFVYIDIKDYAITKIREP